LNSDLPNCTFGESTANDAAIGFRAEESDVAAACAAFLTLAAIGCNACPDTLLHATSGTMAQSILKLSKCLTSFGNSPNPNDFHYFNLDYRHLFRKL
jgi:hypothetical protein